MGALIILRSGAYPEEPWQWRHYFIITDGREVVVHMKPALFGGWRFDEQDPPRVNDGEAWDNWSAESIADHRQRCSDRMERVEPGSLGDFLPLLLERAGVANNHTGDAR